LALLLVTGIGGCTSTRSEPQPSPAQLGWQQLASPDPRAIVHTVVACEGSWFAGGAVQLGGDPSVPPNEQQDALYRPALWRWRDGAWSELKNQPRSYYGERAILRSVACKDGRLAAVGAASGGAHGNPRVTTWLGPVNGPLVQNADQDFELFGGPSAISVGDITAFRAGFAITGNWLNGKQLPSPAVWLSDNGTSWRRLPDLPELTSTAQLARWANAITSDGARLLVAGQERDGTRILPFVVASDDGDKWQRISVPGEGSARWANDHVVLVLTANKVLSWRDGKSSEFTMDAGPRPPELTSAVDTGSVLLAGGCGGTACGVWMQPKGGGWQSTVLPAQLKASPSSAIRLAELDGKALMLLTDGHTAQLFQASLP
jgi:hypothetical protein